MSLLFILGLWLVVGGSVYRSHKLARAMSENRVPDDDAGELASRRVRAGIPDTVPSDWIEAYRSDDGG